MQSERFNVRANVRFRNRMTGEVGVTGILCNRRKGSRVRTHIWVLYLSPAIYQIRVSTSYAYTNYIEIPV